ncbi:MAG: AAA family ATPase [Candidatus Aenigmarchaeota archaeon]|nr:AAA family ATPase [Candidatus Aenigmarchaeota archaeon]
MKTSITKITLQGFKSFNKKISIPFLPGFNIVAGPNGSGKSNILDAIAFVLGRSSAKSLRADRLYELIFNGGEGKTAAEYASVTLYLDNSQKTFPFEDGEVAVTRKVSKNGLSVYKINSKTTTREKILELLSSARIHPDGHNIILQGDVTQIIEMNPIERRYTIDEISGISEYNDKKEKAQKDLDAVDQKLKEAEIIISQRYDIFKKLEDERNAAIKFQNLQKQLIVLKGSLAHKKLTTHEEQIKKLDENLVKKEELNKKLNEEIAQIEAELDKRESSIREVAGKLIDISKRVKIEKEVSELRSKLLIAKDRLDSNAREVDRINSLIDKLEALESRKVELSGEMPRAVQAILRLNLRGVLGTIASLISVPENYRVAIEVAAGPHLNDIVVEDENVASYCIDYLKRERIGRATFLPLNKIRPILFRDNELLGKHGVVNVASKLIKYDSKHMSAIEFAFGNTLVVDKLETAKILGIGKARMVTLDGDLIERSGAMIGGHYLKTHPKFVETATNKEIETYINRRKELEEEIKSFRQDVFELEKKLKEYAVSETTKELIDLEKIRVSSEREVDELRERRKKNHGRRINLEIELNTAKIEKAKLEAELENVRTELQQYGQIEYVDEKLYALENFIKKAQREIEEIGLVNLKAIDEYEKFKNEFDQYKEKYEKILLEKKAVIDMIEQIEQRRMEVFNKCLQEVGSNFNEIYTKMSGGTAKLELENPADIESGLAIEANPAGKKLLNIDSMSGGEKTLAALAFLFAIQKYKPAPFYMFDEVDAALDKENSLKLAELIKSLSKSEQFIMITHNDQTIKSGDRVYGCTMDRGETKIVGLEMPPK